MNYNESELLLNIADNVDRYLKKFGVMEISRKTGIDRTLLYRIRQGEILPSLKSLCKLAAAFNTTLDDLTTYHKEINYDTYN